MAHTRNKIIPLAQKYIKGLVTKAYSLQYEKVKHKITKFGDTFVSLSVEYFQFVIKYFVLDKKETIKRAT